LNTYLHKGRRPYQLDESPVLGIGGAGSEATLRLIERILAQQKKHVTPSEGMAVTDLPCADNDFASATWEDAEWQ
jgi:hypothetical protein